MESTPATAETHEISVYTNMQLGACRMRKLGFHLLTRDFGGAGGSDSAPGE
jgi:hypothetical protein